jgi:hypothetical protein
LSFVFEVLVLSVEEQVSVGLHLVGAALIFLLHFDLVHSVLMELGDLV